MAHVIAKASFRTSHGFVHANTSHKATDKVVKEHPSLFWTPDEKAAWQSTAAKDTTETRGRKKAKKASEAD